MERISSELSESCNNDNLTPQQAVQESDHEEREVVPVSSYKENRRENLLALEKRMGSLEALSTQVGVSPSYLSQMKKLRHMGDKVARRIEKRLNLPAGSMDWPSGGVTQAQGTEIKGTLKLGSYSPDQDIQRFLKDFFEIPMGLRAHLFRRMQQFKEYSESLSPFAREHFPMPPDTYEGWLQWRAQLEAEMDAVSRRNATTAQKKPKNDDKKVKT